LQVAACLACIVLLWLRLDALGASEFSGGRLTGPLFTMAELGGLLFFVALPLTFLLRRIAATVALLAVLLCLPLYVYFLLPGPYQWIFKGEYSVPVKGPFHWDSWAVAGTFSLIIAAILSVNAFRYLPQRRA
jgi:hypothetical protein